jgi:peptide/nickel transport system substrate-binding protein
MRALPVLLLALLAACAPVSQRAELASQPGTVTFNLPADPTNLNPLFLHQDAASVEQQVARLAFEPFIDLDANGRTIPELLSRIPTVQNGGLSVDGRTIVYHLRRNVRWSDGVPVTSRDVLFTLRAILDPANPVPSYEGYDLIDRAYARGAHTVVFHLKHAWAPAIATFFSYGFRPQFVLPEHVLAHEAPLAQAPFNADPSVGDGPYRFLSWQHGESLVYVRNDRYWRGEPSLARIEMRIVPNPQTDLVMLRSGQLDWNLIAPVQAANLAGARGVAIETVPTAVIAGLTFNLRRPPLDDVRVRRAIAMSIDREEISRKITLGAYPVTNALQPQFSWAYDPSVREPGYGPKAADALLDASGWKRSGDGVRRKSGKPLTLTYVQFPESVTGVRVATAVQEQLRRRGIDVEIKSVSNAQLFLPGAHGTLASGAFDMAYVPFTMGADPDDSSILRCGAPSNYMRYCSARVDALERAALSETSQPKRAAIYAQIEKQVARDVPILYLFDARYLYAYRTRLHGFAPNAFLPTWNAFSWRTGDVPAFGRNRVFQHVARKAANVRPHAVVPRQVVERNHR